VTEHRIASSLLFRSTLRYLLRHPWQTGLAILGIALGVGVVVSIDLATASARRAFALSTEGVVGRATHQVIGGPRGLPEGVYRALRVDAGVRPSAPLVEGYASAPAFPGRALHLLGVDPFAEAPFRPYLEDLGRPGGGDRRGGADLPTFLTQPATAIVSGPMAREMGLAPGAAIELMIGGTRRTVMIAGLLEPTDALSRQALDGLVVTDIASAQELLGMEGRLSRIDLIAPPGGAGEAMLARARAALPPGAEIVLASARAQSVAQMTRAFDLNLRALSLLALIVGVFLIHNTMTFSVVQRREAIGTLRALGVTRREVFALVAGEAAVLGVLGTVIGLAVGAALGRGLVRLVTQTINDLYFVLSVRELAIDPLVLAKGAALGLAATLLAALAPALEATGAPPRATLSRSVLETRRRRLAPHVAVLGLAVLAGGTALLGVPGVALGPSYVALFAILIGFALLTPLATVLLMRAAEVPLAWAFGALGRMAARGVAAALSRTSVAVAALVVAIATTVGVTVMVQSFRDTVERWLAMTLQADVYVSAPGLVSSRTESTLPPIVVERLITTPGVAGVSTNRTVWVHSPDDPATVRLVALGIGPRSYRAFHFKEGAPEAVWPAFQDGGAVIVSEPYAYRHRLGAGGRVRLLTAGGMREFPIAGVFYDYASEQGAVLMSRRTYDGLWEDRGVSAVALYATPGVSVEGLIGALRERAGGSELFIRSNRALREASLQVFDRTFAITDVLRLLATLVAFVGVLSALMALQFERAREIGVLRAFGLTPPQVWVLVTSQTGLMGLLAGLLALPVGIVLALVLVFVVNRRSFGWTLELTIGPGVLLEALLLAFVAAVLAGLFPAARMATTPPGIALRNE
jgi:putative ABC transport system permease protein